MRHRVPSVFCPVNPDVSLSVLLKSRWRMVFAASDRVNGLLQGSSQHVGVGVQPKNQGVVLPIGWEVRYHSSITVAQAMTVVRSLICIWLSPSGYTAITRQLYALMGDLSRRGQRGFVRKLVRLDLHYDR